MRSLASWSWKRERLDPPRRHSPPAPRDPAEPSGGALMADRPRGTPPAAPSLPPSALTPRGVRSPTCGVVGVALATDPAVAPPVSPPGCTAGGAASASRGGLAGRRSSHCTKGARPTARVAWASATHAPRDPSLSTSSTMASA